MTTIAATSITIITSTVSATGSDVYMVRFADGSAVWQIALLDEGRIGVVSLGP